MSVVEPRYFVLRDDKLRDWVASFVQTAPLGCAVTVGPHDVRTKKQNKMLHDLIREAVAKGLTDDNGRRLTFNEAKVVFKAAWRAEEHDQAPDIVAFGGHAVDLAASTADYTKDELSRLIEFIFMSCAQRGIVLENRS